MRRAARVWYMLDNHNVLTYAIVFLVITIAQLFSAMRIIYISNSKSYAATIIAFFEYLLFALATSFVIVDVAANPIKALVYCLGFAAGVYLGAILEKALARGYISMEITCCTMEIDEIAAFMQRKNIRVLHPEKSTKDTADESMLIATIPRKLQNKTQKGILQIAPSAVIAIGELNSLRDIRQ